MLCNFFFMLVAAGTTAMTLTTYFSLDFHQNPTTFLEPPLINSPPPHPYETSFLLPNTLDDHAINFLYPQDLYYPPLFHSNSAYENIFQFPPQEEQEQDYYNNLLPFPKRQKCFFNENFNDQNYNNFLDFVPNPACSFQLQAEEPALLEAEQYFSATAPPEFMVPQLPQYYCGGNFVANGDGDGGQIMKSGEEDQKITMVSAQSMAARERRRRISEKTQELGNMVPGGPKMNTAQMLHAAGKYIQYLQAQVKMLKLMETLQEEEAAPPTIDEDLQPMFVSPFIQEKMYLEEKCFVPKEFLTTLTNLDSLQSSPSILEDLKQLIESDNKMKAKEE